VVSVNIYLAENIAHSCYNFYCL